MNTDWWKALLRYNEQAEAHRRWEVIGPRQLQETSSVYGGAPLWEGEPPISVPVKIQDGLHLPVTIRSFRNEVANEWIAAFLDGNQLAARRLAMDVASFPIFVTRSLNAARAWLRRTSRGKRRFGLLATSGARRLRAYGLGVTLNASDLPGIVNWFLAEPEDVRSSFALEVTANEFACQGLELDRICVCWEGDMTWVPRTSTWNYKAFKGDVWQSVRKESKQRYVRNSYRVLLSRAREAVVIWVPPGDHTDLTRAVGPMDETFAYLLSCGVRRLEDAERIAMAG